MSGQTIRDVLIRVAIEQKAASLIVPDFGPLIAASTEAGKQSAAAYAQGFQSSARIAPPIMTTSQPPASGGGGGGGTYDDKINAIADKEADKIIEQTRTAQEKFNQSMAEANALYATGKISAETLDRQVAKLAETLAQESGANARAAQAAREKAQAEQQAARAYDAEAKAAADAYSRIMAERAKNQADAERQYDKEAKEALSAYSRIMKEKDRQAAEAAKQSQAQAAEAEKNYDREAQAAMKAYSRIM